MVIKKTRSKRSRIRGLRSCGYGARKKHRGKGSKAGKGMAGTGKRAGQKRTWILRYHPDYLGKHGFTSLKKKKIKTINISEIQEKLESFLKKNLAKQTVNGIELKLPNYKVLSRGSISGKFFIQAHSFSKKAVEKIEKAGGKITTA